MTGPDEGGLPSIEDLTGRARDSGPVAEAMRYELGAGPAPDRPPVELPAVHGLAGDLGLLP